MMEGDRLDWWTRDPEVLQGQPCFAGTRVPLDIVESYRREGVSLEEFLDNYPTVPVELAERAWTVPLHELYKIICGGPSDRYGLPDERFEAARVSHGSSPFARVGMYVPTRGEVQTLPPDALAAILDLWFWESPTELIPTETQIAAVRHDLRGRADAETPQVKALIDLCDEVVET